MLLLLLLFAPSFVVHAQNAKGTALPPGTPVNTQPVPVANCQLPFRFNNVLYYGCTSAGDSKPWCVVPSSADRGPQDWRYCDLATAAATLSKVAGNDKCVAGWSNGGETVVGCIKADSDAGFGCKPDPAGAVLACKVDASLAAASGSQGPSGVVKAAGLAAAGGTPSSGGGAKVPVGAIAGGVGGLVAVALLVGIIVMRRNSNRKKSTWSDTKNSTASYGDGLDVSGPHSSPDDFRFTQDHPVLSNAGPPSVPSDQRYPMPAERCYPVVSTYTPTLGDELEIQPGDKVQLVNEYDDGWCQGINLSRGGAKGVFPKHCIDLTAGYY